MSSSEKKTNVPLDEALSMAGTGSFTYYVIFTSSFVILVGTMTVEAVAVALPTIGCDLGLTSAEKGLLASMVLSGMFFSGPLSGFLSDAYGRKRVSIYGQAVSSVLLLLSSLAPNTTSLMAIFFILGFVLTTAITPIYVLVCEFSPPTVRVMAILIATSMISLSNIILAGLGMLVLPMHIDTSIFGFVTFTSWRLYLVAVSIAMFLALFLLRKIPETPKFLINEGKEEETLEVLKCIYALNMKKNKSEFPVLSVVLDSSDEGYGETREFHNPLIRSIAKTMSRTRLLFSKDFLFYTLASWFLFLIQIGAIYTYMLWYPEHMNRITHHSAHSDHYNVTICDLMSQSYTESIAEVTVDCQLDYGFFYYSIMLGLFQLVAGIIISFYADKIGQKLLLVCLSFAAAGVNSMVVFINTKYLTITALTFMIVNNGVGFPLVTSLVIDFYPTYARSTASAVAAIFGRLGAAGGNQIAGAMYENYCGSLYFGITGLLIASGLLGLLLPSKKKFCDDRSGQTRRKN